MSSQIPNFIIFGAMRCGSTTLHNLLSQHPDIFMAPNRKELNFFFHLLQGKASIDDYSKYFEGWSEQKAIGEGSVSYIYHRPIAQAIKEHLPNVKLICILRNPARRAFSNYLLTLNWGKEWLVFEDAIKQEHERIGNIADTPEVSYYSYISRGYYAQQLKHYLNYFPRENIHIVLFENLVRDPLSELNKVWGFLDIEQEMNIEMIIRGSQGANSNQYPIYSRLIRHLAYLRFKAFKEKRFVWRFDLLLHNIQKKIPRTDKIPVLPDVLYRKLMGMFEGDIRELAQLGCLSALEWLD